MKLPAVQYTDLNVAARDSTRPYRLWNAKTQAFERWRCFAIRQNAHMGALIEARWAPIGTTLEVIDARTGKLLGQYTRHVNDIFFLGGD